MLQQNGDGKESVYWRRSRLEITYGRTSTCTWHRWRNNAEQSRGISSLNLNGNPNIFLEKHVPVGHGSRRKFPVLFLTIVFNKTLYALSVYYGYLTERQKGVLQRVLDTATSRGEYIIFFNILTVGCLWENINGFYSYCHSLTVITYAVTWLASDTSSYRICKSVSCTYISLVISGAAVGTKEEEEAVV